MQYRQKFSRTATAQENYFRVDIAGLLEFHPVRNAPGEQRRQQRLDWECRGRAPSITVFACHREQR